jgi:hypothetical protein
VDLIGKQVEWEASGRGRGTVLTGDVVLYVPPGTTNEDALKVLEARHPELIIRPKYLRFDLKTHRTSRVFVLVEKPTKRVRDTIYWIYAPNTAELSVI